MVEFRLPDVGEGMHEAEIIRWLVKPGERVKLDQPMLEIQTDKALVEIPSPVAGVVGELRFKEGQIAHVGDVLISFETEESRAETKIAPKAESHVMAQAEAVAAAVYKSPASGGRVRAAPVVRKKALELDIDLGQVQPSSPDGRVLLQDVLNFAEMRQRGAVAVSNGNAKAEPPPVQKQPAVAEQTPVEVSNGHASSEPVVAPTPAYKPSTPAGGEERKALVGLRRRIAERMEQAWRTIPHVTTFEDVDAEQLKLTRESLLPAAEKRGVKLTYLAIIVKAVVQALRQNPIFNSSLDEQTREIIYKRYFHIGLATATPDGLLVPVVRDADRLTLLELAGEIGRLAEGARNRSLKPQELSGSTFTITNFGSYGGRMGTPIINPPEVGILGVGQLGDQVVPRNGQPTVRPILPLALSFDHRLIDGTDSGQFMNQIKQILENPALLMLDMV